MKKELEVNDSVFVDGKKYKIVKFHKGFGNSEVTATLIDENGQTTDILKRILVEKVEKESDSDFENIVEIAVKQKGKKAKNEKG